MLARIAARGTRKLSASPDGTLLASAGTDGSVRLYDASSLALQRELTGHAGECHDVAFSPEGTLVASGGYDSTILVHEVATGRPVARILTGVRPQGPISVLALEFSPDGERLAATTEDGRLLLWRTRFWERVLEFRPHLDAVHALSFDHEGIQLATASVDGSIGIWEAQRPEERIWALENRERQVVAWRPRLRELAPEEDQLQLILAESGESAALYPVLRQLVLGSR